MNRNLQALLAQLQAKQLTAKAEIPESILKAYDPTIRAAADDEPGSIGIYGRIGADPFTGEGFTDRMLAGILRGMNGRDVVLNINSPGGDVYQGLAIYNTLANYPGKVTARVLGVAASAASFVAMAANEIQIGRAASMMIHNTQTIVAGDRNALRDTADWMEQFDNLLIGIYAERTGKSPRELGKMLDAETHLVGGQAAIDAGFADSLLPADAVRNAEPVATNEVREAERTLRALGLSRTDAQTMIANIKASVSDSRAPAGLSDSAGDASPVTELIESLGLRRKS